MTIVHFACVTFVCYICLLHLRVLQIRNLSVELACEQSVKCKTTEKRAARYDHLKSKIFRLLVARLSYPVQKAHTQISS